VEVDDVPTQQQYAAFEALNQKTEPLIAQWKEIRSRDLVALNEMIRQNVPAIYLGSGENPARARKATGEIHKYK